MSVTPVKIANSALIKVGSGPIQDLDEDTKRAVIISAIYDTIRDEVLRAHPWNFALKRAVLFPNSDTPPFEFTYTYDLPSDCLRPLKMDDPEIVWVEESRQILTDETTLNMTYIFRNEDESSWDSSFEEAFAWRLAREVSYALTQSQAVVQACDAGYKRALGDARSYDGVTGRMDVFIADEWTKARR